jgi:uncharacterized protein (TIGR00725 family)
VAKKRQILIIGNNDEGCTLELEKIAYDIGVEVAKSESVLVTGGLGGVMRAAGKGAKDTGGLVLGIIPQSDASFANEYCDIVVPTGMGLTRDFLTALSADGVIALGGGSGTLSELCASYMHKKPIAAIRNVDGSVSNFVDKYLDHRQIVKIQGVDSAKEAVQYLLEKITS